MRNGIGRTGTGEISIIDQDSFDDLNRFRAIGVEQASAVFPTNFSISDDYNFIVYNRNIKDGQGLISQIVMYNFEHSEETVIAQSDDFFNTSYLM